LRLPLAAARCLSHACASSVTVTVTDRCAALTVDVRDDGVGGADPAGRGLRGITDRVEAIGGAVRVSSPAGDGRPVGVGG
jgi:signal transduction histidine kinase